MADHEHTRQRFEDRCWQHYMAERERRDLPGDVVDEFPTREQLFWRQPGGAYGVLMFNAAWQAWCWALEETKQSGVALKPEHVMNWGDKQQSALNDWFLSLPEGRQKALIDDKWMLAGAAFMAGQSEQALSSSQPVAHPNDDIWGSCNAHFGPSEGTNAN